MILLTGTYIHRSEERMAEYIGALKENLKCSHLEEIHLFIEDPVEGYWRAVTDPSPNRRSSLQVLDEILKHPKVKVKEHGRRALYQEYFAYANALGSGKTVILSNADIWFDDTLWKMSLIDLANTFVLLAKWDGHMMVSPADSQDSWVFKTPLRPFLSDWTLGVPGCENRIAYEAKNAGYTMLNPSWSIRAHHSHASNIRTWTHADRLKGEFFTLQPVTLPGHEKDMPIYRAV
jgi:hypothetical protein